MIVVCYVLLVGHSSKIREKIIFASLVFVHFAFAPFPLLRGKSKIKITTKIVKSKTKCHPFYFVFVPYSAKAKKKKKTKMSIGKRKMGNISVAKTIFPQNKQLAQQFGQRRSSKPSTPAFCSTKKKSYCFNLKELHMHIY
jgi:hypothetical protein